CQAPAAIPDTGKANTASAGRSARCSPRSATAGRSACTAAGRFRAGRIHAPVSNRGGSRSSAGCTFASAPGDYQGPAAIPDTGKANTASAGRSARCSPRSATAGRSACTAAGRFRAGRIHAPVSNRGGSRGSAGCTFASASGDCQDPAAIDRACGADTARACGTASGVVTRRIHAIVSGAGRPDGRANATTAAARFEFPRRFHADVSAILHAIRSGARGLAGAAAAASGGR
ncbi:MAG: hypothetical protein ABSH00_16690, partial [Bryobacteraceae bacterium]